MEKTWGLYHSVDGHVQSPGLGFSVQERCGAVGTGPEKDDQRLEHLCSVYFAVPSDFVPFPGRKATPNVPESTERWKSSSPHPKTCWTDARTKCRHHQPSRKLLKEAFIPQGLILPPNERLLNYNATQMNKMQSLTLCALCVSGLIFN